MKLETKSTKLKIPLTHMADIAYLLLVFIIIFSLISRDFQAPVELPTSTSGEEGEVECLWLYVNTDNYSFDSKVYPDLNSLASELKTRKKNIPIRVIAQKQTELGRIKPLIRLMNKEKFTTIEFLVTK